MSDGTAGEGRVGFAPGTVGALEWLGAALAAVTGLVHLYLFLREGTVAFLLAGLGFFGAIVLLVVLQGTYRLLLYAVGIPYVLVQIAGYYTIQRPDGLAAVTTVALVDKVVQVVLVVLLAYLLYVGWRRR